MEAAELLKKVKKIEIKTRGLSEQVFSGQYHTTFKGRGMAFSEVREYQYGDDIRNIDWNVTARFHHPYVKVFEEERELTFTILVDVSSSNEFGSTTHSKRDVLTEIAAVLAFSAIQNNDKVGVIFFSTKVEKYIPPQKGKSHILRIIRELVNFKPQNKGTNISEALRFLKNVNKRKSVAFLISDFIDDQFEEALKIVSKKHDLCAICLYDPMELEIPNIGLVRMQDSETGETFMLDTSSQYNREQYTSFYRNKINSAQQILRKYGLRFTQISTREDYMKPLIGMLKNDR